MSVQSDKCSLIRQAYEEMGLRVSVTYDRINNNYLCALGNGLVTKLSMELADKMISDRLLPTEEDRSEYKDKLSDKEDIIGHPNHYCAGRKYEPKDVIRDWNLNFNLGNAVKYISRNGRKYGNSSLQDLKKARQYLDFEIDYLESKGE